MRTHPTIMAAGMGICMARGMRHWACPTANEAPYPTQLASPKPTAIIMPCRPTRKPRLEGCAVSDRYTGTMERRLPQPMPARKRPRIIMAEWTAAVWRTAPTMAVRSACVRVSGSDGVGVGWEQPTQKGHGRHGILAAEAIGHKAAGHAADGLAGIVHGHNGAGKGRVGQRRAVKVQLEGVVAQRRGNDARVEAVDEAAHGDDEGNGNDDEGGHDGLRLCIQLESAALDSILACRAICLHVLSRGNGAGCLMYTYMHVYMLVCIMQTCAAPDFPGPRIYPRMTVSARLVRLIARGMGSLSSGIEWTCQARPHDGLVA